MSSQVRCFETGACAHDTRSGHGHGELFWEMREWGSLVGVGRKGLVSRQGGLVLDLSSAHGVASQRF